MSLGDPIITLAGLAKIELPARTLFLCDGGQVKWAAETYTGDDSEFGVIGGITGLRESVGDMAPGGQISFLPKTASAASALSQPLYQNSRIRFWLAEIDRITGTVAGTPDLIFDGLLDSTTLRVGMGTRVLDMTFISRAEKLFSVNEGNVCSSRWHGTIWAGELGFDNATDAQTTIAWGIESPPRGTVSSGGFGGGGGGGGFGNNVQFV